MKNASSLPLVSVVMPAYNAQAFIEAAVRSVAEQTYPRKEVVVAPDDRQDYSWLQDKFGPLVRVMKSSDYQTGRGPARNRALSVAQGDFFTALDADSLLAPDYLEQAMALAHSQGLCFARCNLVNDQDERIRSPGLKGPRVSVESFSAALCSLRATVHRSLESGYLCTVEEDVLHDATLLAWRGPSPLLETGYFQRVPILNSADSVVPVDVDREYQRIAHACREKPEEVCLGMLTLKQREQVARLFDARLQASQELAPVKR